MHTNGNALAATRAHTTGLARRPNCIAPSRRRRLPPYARRLAELLADHEAWPSYNGTSADGRHLTIRVIAGDDAWDKAREWGPLRPAVLFVLAPPDEDPAGFDWSLAAGHPPVLLAIAGVLNRDDEIRLAASILRDGAEAVLVVARDRMQRYLGARGEVTHG